MHPGKQPAVTGGRNVAPRPDRKQTILLAAEMLFARHGYHSVTIRHIAEEAGVPLALVGYYYGQKHELFEAIFQHWNATIEERLANLGNAVATSGPDLLLRIVEAFVQPVLRLRASPEGEFYALLVARELAYNSPEAERVLQTQFDPMAHAFFIDAIHAALPHATRADAAWAYQFSLGALLHHLSDHRIERLSRGATKANDPSAHGRLVRFIEAGIRAALPLPEPRRKQTTHRRHP